jgi:hypothetical protein
MSGQHLDRSSLLAGWSKRRSAAEVSVAHQFRRNWFFRPL